MQTDRHTNYFSLLFLTYLILGIEVNTKRQVQNIEIFKISYFSFTFKFNEKKKVQLKNMIWKWRGYKKIFTGVGGDDI